MVPELLKRKERMKREREREGEHVCSIAHCASSAVGALEVLRYWCVDSQRGWGGWVGEC